MPIHHGNDRSVAQDDLRFFRFRMPRANNDAVAPVHPRRVHAQHAVRIGQSDDVATRLDLPFAYVLFDAARRDTPPAFYSELESQLQGCFGAVDVLERSRLDDATGSVATRPRPRAICASRASLRGAAMPDSAQSATSVKPLLGRAIDVGIATDLSDSDLRKHPLAIWIETRLGVSWSEVDQRWVRARPLTLDEASRALNVDSGRNQDVCRNALRSLLLQSSLPERDRLSLTIGDLDVIELNEAFAAQVLGCLAAWEDETYCSKVLGLDKPFGAIDRRKLNVDGGAISLGHPVGTSGNRIVLHLVNAMRRLGEKRGIATECIGGGLGGAMLIEVA